MLPIYQTLLPSGKPLCLSTIKELEQALSNDTTKRTIERYDQNAVRHITAGGLTAKEITGLKRVALMDAIVSTKKRYVIGLDPELLVFCEDGYATRELVDEFCNSIKHLEHVLVYTPTVSDTFEIYRILDCFLKDNPYYRFVVVNHIFDDIEGNCGDSLHWTVVFFKTGLTNDQEEEITNSYSDMFNSLGCSFQNKDDTVAEYALSLCK